MTLEAVAIGFGLSAVALLLISIWMEVSMVRGFRRIEEEAARMPDPDTYWAAYAEGDEEALAEIEAWETGVGR